MPRTVRRSQRTRPRRALTLSAMGDRQRQAHGCPPKHRLWLEPGCPQIGCLVSFAGIHLPRCLVIVLAPVDSVDDCRSCRSRALVTCGQLVGKPGCTCGRMWTTKRPVDSQRGFPHVVPRLSTVLSTGWGVGGCQKVTLSASLICERHHIRWLNPQSYPQHVEEETDRGVPVKVDG